MDIVTPFLKMIRHLLPEGEGTRENMLLNNSYKGLQSALKHTAVLNNSVLEDVIIFLLSRLQSKDRRERLAAGYV